MSDLRKVSSSPHIRDKATSSNIMRDVSIALLPAAAYGVFHFGMNALLTILLSVATCVATEYIYEKLMHKPVTVKDLSAVVTGLLLAMNLPVSVPFWMPILGGIFAILVVKQLFGGLGQNFMNPALGARCFLMISFAGRMTNYTYYALGANSGYDAITTATPLAVLREGASVNVMDMIVGNTAGMIGETSAIAILIGAAYLLFRGVIDLKIPGTYIVTFIVFMVFFGGHGFDGTYLVAQLAGGGLMLGAWFMATDYVTSPITPTGQIVYGVILGILTGIFRCFGASPEGVSYAIIFSNLLVPLIEKYTIPLAFGKAKAKGGQKS
ncbi:MAG: RnfABCDGE type electron transport complex subunit D [Lachnospiraceae bacterium]|nr:RnfABCDGE type electron transport complex subunit D [Lachnospiraceae bacterium]